MFVSRWKSLTKGGKSTLASVWKNWRAPMVLLDGVASVLRGNACIIQVFSLTWTKVHAWHDHANGGEVGYGVDSKHLWEIKGAKSW